MSQHDYNIANATFPNVRSDLNNALGAVATNNAGNSAPSTTYANQWWFDSDGNQLYQRNKDNDAWVKILTIGATSDKVESIADSIAIASTGGVTVTTADNSDALTLKTTDADSNIGPILLFNRDSASPADNDFLGAIDFQGDNDAGETHDYIRILSRALDVSNGAEKADLVIKDATGNNIVNMAHTEIVFNDDSVDRDFRIESNDYTHAFHVNAGNNSVSTGAIERAFGLFTVTSGDSNCTGANANGDEFVIEVQNSINGGMSILTDNSRTGAIIFGDQDDNDRGRIAYDHPNDRFFIDTNGNDAPCFFFNNGSFATNGESAADVDQGGLTLDQNAGDSQILTFKSSDIAHGMTVVNETDTYGDFRKANAVEGGLQVRGTSESASPGFVIDGIVSSSSDNSNTGAEAPVHITGRKQNGTTTQVMGAANNLVAVRNSGDTKFIIKGDGEIFSDQSATVGTYDTYEDAQLVRSLELSRGSAMTGLINSQFDKYIKYNHETLAEANLVGREKDGTPNHFVNITGMQRLHNGAIWQQYEKTERLAKAVYELAKVAVGEDKANEILEQNEIKLLN